MGERFVDRKKTLTALMASCVLAVAGCTDDGATAPAAPAADDALAQLRAAAAKTTSVPGHVTMSAPNVEVTGDTDAAGRATALVITTDSNGEKTRQEVRVFGDDAYYKLGKTILPNLDATKFIAFPAADFATVSLVHLGDPFDPAGAKGLTAAATSATRAGDGTYTGTADLSGAPGATSRGLLPGTAEQLERGGANLKAVPFEATVDRQGQLTSLTVRVPAYGSAPARDSRTRFSALGTPVTVAAPTAAEITDVPDSLRKLLAG
ncbi:hypothetical protein QLQ12_46650 [Actinoplanes sp. NEAU-A12]|uniref:Lipoprotein n=1 Tax=Actinoplanes sandaracinus TaxID=3045177 RepID=A0ABT6X232_9ACTN|nr:hypothetical protein [Actinoplanes sandaracinus]MDI6106064.1 hypothetical protein [Actinoplanes sandaracinus]